MAKIKIDPDRCKGCLLCINFCPKNGIKKSSKLNKKGLPFAEVNDSVECSGCTMCALICPECCIEIWKE